MLTGFLGAGKTTLLNRLLKDPALADTAVIINEFGEVAIDHLLVEQASDGIIQLSDGCLCCTVRGELVDTLADLVDRVQTGRIARLTRVVIETTGLADPAPVLQSIMAHPALVQAFRLDGVVTLVDAVNGGATLDAHVEAVKQVAVADRIVLTKADLATDPRDVEALRARLRQINPGAVILDAGDSRTGVGGAVRLRPLQSGHQDPPTCGAGWARTAPTTTIDHGDHDQHGDHDHDASPRHDRRMRSYSLVHDGPVPFSAIEMFLDLLRSAHGERLLRMKGVIELAGRPVAAAGRPRRAEDPASAGAAAGLARRASAARGWC